MFLLDYTKLKKGDIILSRRDNETSERIRELTKSDFSHVRLYVGAQSCIDSDGPGVHAENIQRIAFEKETDVLVLRYFQELDQRIIDEVIVSARRKIGTQYSKSEARKAVRSPDINAAEPNRQFCTRFVAQAYFEAGYTVVENPNYCTPNDFVRSNMMIKVESPLRVADKVDMEIVHQDDSLTGFQKQVINDLMEQIRSLTGDDIQVFEQIGDYLIKNPQHDAGVVRILHATGFTSMWMIVRNESPHFYDYNLLVEAMPNQEERISFAKQQVIDEPDIRRRFEESFETNRNYYNKYKLEFFKTLRDLNRLLSNESKWRQTICLIASRG